MSWRDVLKSAASSVRPYTHNPQNTHKAPTKDNSAYIADCAGEVLKSPERYSVAGTKVVVFPAMIDDRQTAVKANRSPGTNAQAALTRSLVQRRDMDEGRVPAHFTEPAACKQCGPVWLWFHGEIRGCPWCWNRLAGRSIPRPKIASDIKRHVKVGQTNESSFLLISVKSGGGNGRIR